MTQESILWTTNGTGDGAADITQAQWIDFFHMLFLRSYTTEGVAAGYLSALAVTSPGANTLRVASGGGVVRGFLYRNTANVDITIPSPAADTGFRIVLRAGWVAQTVRATYILNTTGVTDAPAVTQNDGVTWEISLASGVISAAGAISGLTDTRAYMHYNTAVSTTMIDDLNVTTAKINDLAVTTAKIADSNVTNAKMADNSVDTLEIVNLAVTTAKVAADAITKEKLANVYIELLQHQGNNVADWEQPGTSNFAVSQVTAHNGSIEIIMASPNDGTTVTVSFPATFANKPNIQLTIQKMVLTGTGTVRGGYVTCTALSASQMTIALWRRDPADTSEDLTAQVHWVAMQGDNS